VTRDYTFEGYPSVTPDGQKVAFVSARSGWGIWIRDLASGKETPLLSSPFFDMQPKISANGVSVAYWQKDRMGYWTSTRGGAPQLVCPRCGPPTDISADGSRALFESVGEGIALADIPNRKQQTVMIPDKHPRYFLFGGHFSPDGKWIAFHANTGDATKRQIFVAPDAAKSEDEWIPITDGNAADREAYWSGDGRLLYFLSDRDGFRCVWAVKLDPATHKPSGDAFAVSHFHHVRRSLTGVGRSRGEVMSVARDRILLAVGELTGNVWTLSPANR
jgi:Tol biopolymer transport system component